MDDNLAWVIALFYFFMLGKDMLTVTAPKTDIFACTHPIAWRYCNPYSNPGTDICDYKYIPRMDRIHQTNPQEKFVTWRQHVDIFLPSKPSDKHQYMHTFLGHVVLAKAPGICTSITPSDPASHCGCVVMWKPHGSCRTWLWKSLVNTLASHLSLHIYIEMLFSPACIGSISVTVVRLQLRLVFALSTHYIIYKVSI